VRDLDDDEPGTAALSASSPSTASPRLLDD